MTHSAARAWHSLLGQLDYQIVLQNTVGGTARWARGQIQIKNVLNLMRVLDLGCGSGHAPKHFRLPDDCEVLGVDADRGTLEQAHINYPHRRYCVGRGENLPYHAEFFDQVIANVSLPYMNIPKTLREVRRVLKPSGTLVFSLHPFSFTWSELKKTRHIRAATFRVFVMINGIYFHLTGRVLHLFGKAESFQTERGIRMAMARAGFSQIVCKRNELRFIVRACASAVTADPNPNCSPEHAQGSVDEPSHAA
jgi:ubiquinone/menaquinone biosynthesis C-methylase UbiE